MHIFAEHICIDAPSPPVGTGLINTAQAQHTHTQTHDTLECGPLSTHFAIAGARASTQFADTHDVAAAENLINQPAGEQTHTFIYA